MRVALVGLPLLVGLGACQAEATPPPVVAEPVPRPTLGAEATTPRPAEPSEWMAAWIQLFYTNTQEGRGEDFAAAARAADPYYLASRACALIFDPDPALDADRAYAEFEALNFWHWRVPYRPADLPIAAYYTTRDAIDVCKKDTTVRAMMELVELEPSGRVVPTAWPTP